MSNPNLNTQDLKHDPRIVIIGAGMAGILSAIKFREAGYDNFIIYEKSDALGGTWRANTYPGAGLRRAGRIRTPILLSPTRTGARYLLRVLRFGLISRMLLRNTPL